jgi:hypothetical protein
VRGRFTARTPKGLLEPHSYLSLCGGRRSVYLVSSPSPAGGSPEGVGLVYKSNRSGLALACPRCRYAEARLARDEFRTPGVYVLFGPAEAGKTRHPEDAVRGRRRGVGLKRSVHPAWRRPGTRHEPVPLIHRMGDAGCGRDSSADPSTI